MFKDTRIIVEANLRNFIPSKRKPQKMLSYKPPPKIAPNENTELPSEMDIEQIN